ncbi:MAG: hypothetical protein LQ338_005329 [Usnochroma carphineum]|nr:MAG: hypothetical protein LQ338_005329 [Usnochroma carphineum]
MKSTSTLLSLLALALTSHAQSINDVPQCASTPALQAFTSTGCQLTDFSCICKDQSFITSLLPVVQKACSPEDFQKTLTFTQNLCKANGAPLSITTSASSAETTSVTSTLPAASASGTGGSLHPGNSTNGGKPTTPSPSPASAPSSGVEGMIGLVHVGMLVCGVMAGAVLQL